MKPSFRRGGRSTKAFPTFLSNWVFAALGIIGIIGQALAQMLRPNILLGFRAG